MSWFMGETISSVMGFAMGSKCNDQSSFPFLLLPFEIRLQIYHYIIQDQPTRHSQLSTLHSQRPATSVAYFDQALPTSSGLAITSGRDLKSQNSTLTLALPYPASPKPAQSTSTGPRGHGCGHIPSNILRTCKQINAEARTLAFKQNEFVFINWFCSGVYAARSFMRALEPWQRNAMRYARVEVLKRDLENSWVASMVGGKPGTGEWKDLCGLWSGSEETGLANSGLWGLKLGVMGRVSQGRVFKSINDGNSESIVEVPEPGAKEPDSETSKTEADILDVNAPWITEGLVQMRNLKWLEIEIEDKRIPHDHKVRFCVELGRKLNALRSEERNDVEGSVDVTLVERALPKQNIEDKPIEVGWEAPRSMFISGLYMDIDRRVCGMAL